MIKLIASDLDGTLLNGKDGISPFTLEKIKEAMQRGVHFVIASGRAYQDIEPIMKSHDLKCACVTGNGAEYIDEEGIYQSAFYLSYDHTCTVCQFLKEDNINFMIYCTDGIYSIDLPEKVQEAFVLRGLHNQKGETYEEVKEHLKKHHSIFKMTQLKNLEDLKDKHIIKVEAFDIDQSKIRRAKEKIARLDVSYLSSFPDNVEITHKEATKGAILEHAIKKLNIQPDEVMVIGDGDNDLTMFERFHYSIAMENANDRVKEKAFALTDHFKADGVGKAIEKWVLI